MPSHHHHRRHWHHGHRRLQVTPIQAVLILILAVAVLAAGYYFVHRIDESQRSPEPVGDPEARHAYDTTLEYDGHTYRQRSNVTSILLMGIDNEEAGTTSVGERGGGQADFLRLIVIDKGNKTVSQLAIDRDTMTEITILGVLGNPSGTRIDNISLSHYFGDGKEKSCELTRSAVSKLLFGTRINFYMAMNLDGIAAFNDALGGVTVTLEDDFSATDPSWVPGAEVTLTGSQAETFVRSRRSIGDGTNESRMRRQQQYISQAAHTLEEKIRKDTHFIGRMFDRLSPYLVSGIQRSLLVAEAYGARDYERPATYTIAGEHIEGEDGFMQFWPDKDQLMETTLKLFYQQVN